MDIQDIIDLLKTGYQPEKIILFGSRANGTASLDSDLDIAIIKETNKSYHDRLIDVRRLVRTTKPIDFFVFTEDEILREEKRNPFIREIMTKGKLVYEA